MHKRIGNKRLVWRILFPAIFIFFSVTASAQSGTWNPAGADLTYPRTLLKAAHIPAVQQALSLAGNLQIYTGLYNSVKGTPPGTPTADHSSRRSHAAFAKNLAFVVLMDRKPAGTTLTSLTAQERDTYIGNVRTMLNNLNTTVESWPSYTNWQWVSKELIDYMVAYDLLRGAGETDTNLLSAKSKLQEFAGNLYTQSQSNYFGYTFFGSIKNNHTLMTAAALGLSAVVLNDASSSSAAYQPQSWINAGMFHVDNVLWRDAQRQSDPNAIAGYAEGPYYFKYAFLNCLPFIRSMGHFLPDNSYNYYVGTTTRSIRNPYYDPSYDRLYQWMSAILMPDGRFPALEDSYIDMGMPELALTGKSAYVQPMYFQNFAPGQLASLEAQLRDATVDMRAAYLAANIIPATASHPALTALPQSGNLVFRSGNDPQSHYLHVYGKNGLAQTVTGGHNQGDASSFILHAKGQLLALDPGYLSAGRRDSLGNAVNHNLILVDGQGPLIGTDGTTNDAEAFIEKPFSQGDLSYGQVRTNYQSTAITRKTLSVRNNYFLVADFVESATPRNFTWQLHGYGLEGGTATTGTFTDNLATHQATWHKNGVNLKAHVTATNHASAYTKGTNYHERTYNQSEKHTTLLVQKDGVAKTQFLSLLVPYTDQAPAVTTMSTATTAALQVTSPDYQDLAFIQANPVLTTQNGLPQPVSSDALTTLVSLNPDNTVREAFLEQGQTLQYGATTLIQSSQRANIMWQQVAPNQYSVYVDQPTTLSLPVERRPSSVTGTSDYSYDASAQTLSLTVSGQSAPTTLGYTLEETTLPVELVQFTGRREQHQVLLSWQTATEHNNSGFAVLRRTDQEAAFQQIDFVKGAGTTLLPSRYQYRDLSAPATTVYYRLRQTDLDGTTSYSPVIAVKANASAPPALTVAPVPADSYLQVSFPDPNQPVLLQLLRVDGRLMQQARFAGRLQLDVSQLPAGMYVLQALDSRGQPLAPRRKIIIKH